MTSGLRERDEARAERDEAVAKFAALQEWATLLGERRDEAIRAKEAAEAERDVWHEQAEQAVADNAALLKDVLIVRGLFATHSADAAHRVLSAIADEPHPGAALPARLRAAEGLRPYAWHQGGCPCAGTTLVGGVDIPNRLPCSCGLEAALAAWEREAQQT